LDAGFLMKKPMKTKMRPAKYETDQRIKATPKQLASALTRGGAPRREESASKKNSA